MAYFNSSLYDSGNNLNFEVTPDMGIKTSKEFANTMHESFGGVEYMTKAHSGKKVWVFNWSNISVTFKAQLENFRNAVSGNFSSFTYNDGSSNYTVRMTENSLQFSEVNYQRFSTSIELREVSPS